MEPVEIMTPAEAGKVLHKNAETIRSGLRQGTLPIGCAIKNEKTGQWNYIIVKNKLKHWIEEKEEGDDSQ